MELVKSRGLLTRERVLRATMGNREKSGEPAVRFWQSQGTYVEFSGEQAE